MEENTNINSEFEYGSDAIKTLDWKEHIRRRPGMYIGKLGDGSHADDGIYVLLKEVLDDKALTALIPTPFRPTDFLNAFESYLPPVFILEETSFTLSRGIPRP